jgi:cell division protein FtsW (lipid II flippase)
MLLSLSRVFLLIVSLISMCFWLRLSLRTIQRICLLVFFVVAIPNVYGLIDGTWNPYAMFAGDVSGRYRMMEYDVARLVIWQNPISGFGLSPSGDATQVALQFYAFSAADLGPSGVWFDWGATGFICFILLVLLCCRAIRARDRSLSTPLALTGCYFAAYACLAPVLLTSTHFAIILGIWVGQVNVSTRANKPLPWSARARLNGNPRAII